MMEIDTLYAAAIAGDADAIAKLAMEADKVDQDDGETILHIESRRGNTEHVRFILREFASKNLLVKLSLYKHTALHLAIYEGKTEVAEILIDAARDLPVTSFQAFLREGDKDMDTALHAAVMEGNVAVVRLLVEADPTDTHIQNNKGKTPMYIAVEKGFNDIVEIISTTCRAPSLHGPYGSTAVRIKNIDQGQSPGGTLYKIMDRYDFYVAATAGDADAIAKLEMEADVLNGGEETILNVETQIRNAERVRSIMRELAKKNLLAAVNSAEQTALHLAVVNGHTQLAEILIDAARHLPVSSFQAFLRQADNFLDTALHVAVRERHTSIVKLLVEADPSDTHTKNYGDKTPMYIAVQQGLNDIVQIISTTCTAPSLDGPYYDGTALRIKNLDQGKSPGGTVYEIFNIRDALFEDAIAGDADAIAKLEMEADILNIYEETILHVESKEGNAEHVRFILREFAHKNLLVKVDDKKQTALTWAASLGHTEVAEVLIDAARHLPPSANDNPVTSFQAFLRLGDKHMNTALHTAVRSNKIAIVKLLVDADPSDRHKQNKDGETPIYIAVERGYYNIVKMICTTCIAPLDLEGPAGGTTALHVAIKNLNKAGEEHRDVIKVIIEAVKGTWKRRKFIELFNRSDEKRCIILELAVEGNYLDVVELILSQNPAYDLFYTPDFIGLLPLIYKAMEEENNDMVNLLTEAYQRGLQSNITFNLVGRLISAISSSKEEYVLNTLEYDEEVNKFVAFADNLGWTLLHHAAYHEFDSIIDVIVEAKKKI